jgi:hypothetical protein
VPGPLDSFRKQALVCRADSADSSGQYFPSLGNKMAEKFPVFEIYIGDFFGTKFADSLAPDAEPFWTWHCS